MGYLFSLAGPGGMPMRGMMPGGKPAMMQGGPPPRNMPPGMQQFPPHMRVCKQIITMK